MTVKPGQTDPKFNHSRMNCRDFIWVPLDIYGIYASIDNQMLKTPHNILVHLAALDNGRNSDIGKLKNRGVTYSKSA